MPNRTNTLPYEAIEAFRNGTVRSDTALSVELYEFLVRVSDKQWVTHFKRRSNDWHSSALIREDYNVSLLDFMLMKRIRYTREEGRACDISEPREYCTPALCYWLWKLQTPLIITLLTAKYVGIDYIGKRPINEVCKYRQSEEFHRATVWLRKRFAYDGVDLYSPRLSGHYVPELIQFLGHSKDPYILQRRYDIAYDALYALCNRFPSYTGAITNDYTN